LVKVRRRVLENLTPGTVYAVPVRAVGGSTRYSDWSGPVFRMARVLISWCPFWAAKGACAVAGAR